MVSRSQAMLTDATEPSPPDAVDVEPLADVPRVRRADDVFRLVLALTAVVTGALVAALADTGVRATERNLLETIVTLPPSLRDALTVALQLLAVLIPAAIVVSLAIRRRFAVVGWAVLAGLAATLVGLIVSHLILGNSHPSIWPDVLAGRQGLAAVTFPPAVWLAATTAIATVSGPQTSSRWRRGLWWLIGGVAGVEVLVGGVLPIDAVVAAALGITVGSAMLLVVGAPPRRPAPTQVLAALQECGVEVVALKQLPAGPGPAIFSATTRDGTPLALRVYAGDDRDNDLLTRFSRWLLVRGAPDDRAGVTVESAAEHEMLAMVSATRAGARIPEPVVAYPVKGKRGVSGALVAWIDVGGQRLDRIPADEITDAALADLWHSVSELGRHRMAHRLLRVDHVTVDGSDRAWLTGLVLAELGATDRQISTDVAELLASLAVQIGPDRAVASAVAGLGAPAVAAAAPYVQPLAVSGPTWRRIRGYDRSRSETLTRGGARRGLRPGGRPNLFADVRIAVGKSAGASPAKPEQLARFTWKKALTLLGAFAAIYLVLPQLANAGAAVHALRTADWWWVLAAVPALFVGQGFSTLLQLGTIPAEMPFGPTYVVGFGASFLNRVTPNNVGGMALNFRYLQNAGLDSGGATGAVGLQTVAGIGAILVLMAAFFALTGRDTAVHFSFHVHQWVLLLVAAVLVASALFGLSPRGRRFFHDKIWGFVRSAGAAIAQVAKSPRHTALTVVGAVGGPMVQIVALWLCVHALGGRVPFVQVGAVYLGAHLVASAAPVPGGLGALEAALIAGFSALGMPAGAAASAVLIYRLLTYWLTIPVGWFNLRVAEGRGYV